MANSRKPLHAEVPAAVRQSLRNHAGAADRLCVGLSGGLDSVVLLACLHVLAPEFRLRLSALHVNHQLQAEAGRWEAFCRDYCERLGVPCAVERVSVSRAGGESLEAEARAQRYAAFARQPADFIALAHHREDQAETVLIQLLRGAGLNGLRAMPETRALNGPSEAGPRLLRPLLQVPRAALREYAAVHGLAWVEDPSNLQTHHARNYLRHDVLPVLARRFPSWAGTLGRSARHLAEAGELLDQLAEADFTECRQGEGIRIGAALERGELRAVNLLRWWIRRQGAPVFHQKQLEDWLRQSRACDDRQPSLSWAGWALERFRGCWQLRRTVSGAWPALHFDRWPGGDRILIPGAGALRLRPVRGEGVRLDLLAQGRFSLRRRQGGERLRPAAAGPSRTLRNLLQEAGLPPWWRNALPLLFHGDDLVCVPGVAVDACALPARDETGLSMQWEPFASDAAQQ